MKPIIRWPGCKRKIAKPLGYEIYHQATIGSYYAEPFCGSMAIGLQVLESGFPPYRCHFSDACEDLIIALNETSLDPLGVEAAYDKLRKQSSKEDYIHIRKHRPNNDVERAAWFFYLNSLAHNGLYRVNRKGEFNAPYGDRGKLVDRKFMEFYAKTGQAHFYIVDFEDALRDTLVDCAGSWLVFVDPPYPNTFDQYTAKRFSWDDQVRLSKSCRKSYEVGNKLWITIGDAEGLRELYDWAPSITILEEEFSIGGKKSRRNKSDTLLIRCL